MDAAPSAHFLCEPDPDHPGWHAYELSKPERYNQAFLGRLHIRHEGGETCRVRLHPREIHVNSGGRIHGGTTLGLIDVGIFGAMYLVCGTPVSGSVTVDLQTQFIGAGDPARPLDAVIEVLRETRRLGFLRGLVVQGDEKVAAFSATIRKQAAR